MGVWYATLLSWRPGVESFFVLSGYFLALGYLPRRSDVSFSITRFIARRFTRLLVPYWSATVLVYLLKILVIYTISSVPSTVPRPGAVLANVFCVSDLFGVRPIMGFFWSLQTLIQIHFLWAVVFWVVRRFNVRRGGESLQARVLLILQMVVLGGTLTSAAFAFGWLGFAPDDVSWKLPGWFCYCGLGAAAFWIGVKQISPWVLIGLAATLLAGSWAISHPRPIMAVGTSCLLISATRFHIVLSGLIIRMLGRVGSWSYSIYLTHGIVAAGSVFLVQSSVLGYSNSLALFVYFATGMVGSVGLGGLFWWAVERRSARWASRIEYRVRVPEEAGHKNPS